MIPINWDYMSRIISSYPGEVWIWIRAEKFLIYPEEDHACMTWGGDTSPLWLNIESTKGECDIQITSIRKLSIRSRINITLEGREGAFLRL